jgi:uncharacterized lipoprotein YajG
MEELLYSIKIYKNDTDYLGKIFSNNNEIKDFHSKNIDDLLRDIIADMELDHEESSKLPKDFFEDIE